jgi:hypothetical protein
MLKKLELIVIYVRSEVLTAVKMWMLLFWATPPYGLVGKYHLYKIILS